MIKPAHRAQRIGMAILVAILGLAIQPVVGASGWQRFTHPKYGFSMSFPDGWVSTIPNSRLIAMLAVGPKAASSPDFTMNVNVVIDSIPPQTTIEEFDAIATIKLQEVFPGFRLLRSDRTQVGKYPAVMRYATWQPKEVELYQLQLGVIVGARLYVVTGTTVADSSRIQEEAYLLQQILITFRP